MTDLNDFAQSVDLRQRLREPFPRHLIGQIQKKNRVEDYVGHAAVTDRLNAEAPGWTTSKPDFIIDDNTGHISGVLCSMTIGSVTRWEIGDCETRSTPGDEAKKAMSDFIKRAAMRFGVAVDLWSKEDLTSEGTARPAMAGGKATAEVVAPSDNGAEASGEGGAAPGAGGGTSDPIHAGGGTSDPIPALSFITREQFEDYAQALGGKTELLRKARAKYGDKILSWKDITQSQADALLVQGG